MIRHTTLSFHEDAHKYQSLPLQHHPNQFIRPEDAGSTFLRKIRTCDQSIVLKPLKNTYLYGIQSAFEPHKMWWNIFKLNFIQKQKWIWIFVCYMQIIIPWHIVQLSWMYICVSWPSQLRVEMLIIAHLSFVLPDHVSKSLSVVRALNQMSSVHSITISFKTVLYKLFACRSLLALKNNRGSSHPCSCKYRVSGWQVSNKNLYLRLILDRYSYIPVACITMHCMMWPSLKWLSPCVWVQKVLN